MGLNMSKQVVIKVYLISRVAQRGKLYEQKWATKNYCGVLKEHSIKACAKGQNGGSTNMPFFAKDHKYKECELKYK